MVRIVRVGFIEKIKCEEKNVRRLGERSVLLLLCQKRAFQRKDKHYKAGAGLEWLRFSEEITVSVSGTQ